MNTHVEKEDVILSQFCQSAPKIGKGPAAYSQGNKMKDKMPHQEIRRKTLFTILYINVLFKVFPACPGGSVSDTLDSFYLIDQLFSLPTIHPSTHPDMQLAIWMGGIGTTWRTSLSPAVEQNWPSDPSLTVNIGQHPEIISLVCCRLVSKNLTSTHISLFLFGQMDAT